tara:strand:- start:35 stop:208 length:174 start_codon:yes stop_codon:yes gene_type:complete
MDKDKKIMNKIVLLALDINETKNLSKLVAELQTMEMDKMFPTKENKYYMGGAIKNPF